MLSMVPMNQSIENGKIKPKDFLEWTVEENKRAHYDVRTKNTISSPPTIDEFYRIFVCEFAKEM